MRSLVILVLCAHALRIVSLDNTLVLCAHALKMVSPDNSLRLISTLITIIITVITPLSQSPHSRPVKQKRIRIATIGLCLQTFLVSPSGGSLFVTTSRAGLTSTD